MSPGGKATEETRFRCKEESMYESRQKGGGRVSFLQACWRGNGSSEAGSVLKGWHVPSTSEVTVDLPGGVQGGKEA